MKQAPNRVGNQSKKPANAFSGRAATGGVTNRLPDTTYVAQPKGAQGAPKANGKINVSNLSRGDNGNKGNATPISRPKNDYGNNDGYRAGSSYLK